MGRGQAVLRTFSEMKRALDLRLLRTITLFVLCTLACFRIGTWQVAFADCIPLAPRKSTTYPSGTYKDKGQNPIGSSHDTGLWRLFRSELSLDRTGYSFFTQSFEGWRTCHVRKLVLVLR